MMDLAMFGSAVGLAKQAIDLLKGISDLLPDKGQKEAVQRTLKQAEEQFKIAEATAAREMGYTLCKCTWPPQITISQGRDPRDPYGDIMKCPQCDRIFKNSDMPSLIEDDGF